MRNLKKALSLVLCVAMMLSVMVVGAGAVFSDQSKIEHTEAVDGCATLNIIGGYPDGSFKPEGNITRAEVTKMICVALNGGKEPAVSPNITPTFSDVRGTAAAWAEGYIESCAAQGIVSGVGGGKFAPAGNVTGVQLAKMLLVSLGYNADTEGFTGNAWATNVNVRAAQKGLYDELKDIDVSAPISRDDAAQMVWNALNAYEVEYKTTLTTDANGQLVSQVTLQDRVVGSTNDKITLVEDKYESETEKGILVAVNYNDSDDTYTTVVILPNGDDLTFDADKDYSNLMGQEVKAMYTTDQKTKDTTLLGIYATDKNKTITALMDDVTFSGSTFKIDGKEYDIAPGFIPVAPNGRPGPYMAPFYSVTFIDNNNDKKYEVAVIDPFVVAQVSSLTAKKVIFEEAMTGTAMSTMDLEDVDAYANMAEDDYVILSLADFTVSGKNVAVKADEVSGKVAGTKADGSIKVDGTWYKNADKAKVDAPDSGDNLKYAVVKNGFYFATDAKNGSVDKLALVLKVGDQEFDGDYYDVKLLLSDGTTKVTKAYVKDGSNKYEPDLAELYTYTTNNTGYVLEAITDGEDIGLDPSFIDGMYDSKTNKVTDADTGTSTRLAADAKVFVVYEYNAADNSLKGKVVTGADADKWSDDAYDVMAAYTDTTVKVMVVDQYTGKIPSISDDSLYGVMLTTPYVAKNADDEDIFVVEEFLTEDGSIIELTADVDEVDFLSTPVTQLKNMLVSYQMDGSDYVNITMAPDGGIFDIGAVTDVDGDYITVQAMSSSTPIELKLDKDDSTILYVDTDAGEAASGSIKKATKKDAEYYYANILFIAKGTPEADGSYILWGAEIDVNNQLTLYDKDVEFLVKIP